MTNHEPKHPPADMAGLDDLIWRIKERMPIDHTEMLALAARVKVLEAENEWLRFVNIMCEEYGLEYDGVVKQ